MNIDVDLQLTHTANTLYRLQATGIGNGLKSAKPPTLFHKFVRAGAEVTVETAVADRHVRTLADQSQADAP